MGSLTTAYKTIAIRHLFNLAVADQPDIWMALSSTSINADGTGITELSSGGYARVAVPAWTFSSPRKIVNSAAVAFPTASGAWDPVVAAAFYTDAVGGDMIARASLRQPRACPNGRVATFARGTLSVEFEASAITNYAAQSLLSHFFRKASRNSIYVPSSVFYLALSGTAPGDMTTGTTLVEPAAAAAYTRLLLPAFTNSSSLASNSAGAVFPTATGTFGAMSYCGVLDAVTGGHLLVYGVLAHTISVTANNIPTLPLGALSVSMD